MSTPTLINFKNELIDFGKLKGKTHEELLKIENRNYAKWILLEDDFKYPETKEWLKEQNLDFNEKPEYVVNHFTTIRFGKLKGKCHYELLNPRNSEYREWILNTDDEFKFPKTKEYIVNNPLIKIDEIKNKKVDKCSSSELIQYLMNI